MEAICFGIDVGGTFTDCVLTEGDRVWRAKAPTTPGALGKGVIAAARIAADRRGEARAAYGVVNGDPEATERLRLKMRRDRLSRARPPAKPLVREDVTIEGEPIALYPGIVQVGPVAVASESGAPLALAPDHWTEGCPLLTERRWGGDGPSVVYNSWLDPETGRALHAEVALEGEERCFEVLPKRWTEWNAAWN